MRLLSAYLVEFGSYLEGRLSMQRDSESVLSGVP